MFNKINGSGTALAFSLIAGVATAQAETTIARAYRIDLSKPAYDCLAMSPAFGKKKFNGLYDASARFELLKTTADSLEAQATQSISGAFDGDPARCNITVEFKNVWSRRISFSNAPKINGKAQGPFEKLSQSVSFDFSYELPRFYDASDCKITAATNIPVKTMLGVYGDDAKVRLATRGDRFQDLTLYGFVTLTAQLSIDANGAARLTQVQLAGEPELNWESRLMEIGKGGFKDTELLVCNGSLGR